MKLIGLDIGTTGCKAAVFDEEGAVLASAAREYQVEFPHPGWAEQDLERVWELAQEALAGAAAEAGADGVAAIALSVHGEAVTPVDENGRALRPAILGMDTRTGAENEWLRDRFGARELFLGTGMPVHTINTLPKLLWLKTHEPAVWSKARQFLLVEDFMVRKMTGRAVVSRCLASRTQLYEVAAGRWSDEILGALGLSPDRLAELRPSGDPVGTMSPDLAKRLGLGKPPVVAAGGHDQACGALGVALVEPGRAMVSTGTAEVVELALGSPALNDTLYEGNVSVYVHPAPGLHLAMTLNQSGGFILRWFRDTLCADAVSRAGREGGDPYDMILEGAPEGPTGLMLLPHFSGSGTPTFDTESKGALLGLSFATTRPQMAKAILEGLTFELRVNLDLLRAGGARITELRAIGGGAKSELWLQLKADLTGIPVLRPRVTEAACWGAAILAGTAAGCFRNPSEAAERAFRLERTFEPNAARAAAYADRYAVYRDLYPTLRELLHRIGYSTGGSK